MRWRGWIGGTLFLGIGCFVLLIAVFATVLVASQRTALTLTAKDAGMLVLLYGIAVVFLSGGISVILGGGRWFIRALVSFGRRGGSGRIR
ncbi:MAG: hypothetical protein M3R68_05470 [Acidobacteriota bacterium]|nr:hypothetical protein [Acidobacteriota bacterium]